MQPLSREHGPPQRSPGVTEAHVEELLSGFPEMQKMRPIIQGNGVHEEVFDFDSLQGVQALREVRTC